MVLVHRVASSLMKRSRSNSKGDEDTASSADPTSSSDLKDETELNSHEMVHLGTMHRNVVPQRCIQLRHGYLFVSQGSVVHFEGDAIVNAANEGGLGGSGVDGAISNAGGDSLYEARKALPVLGTTPNLRNKRIRTGCAVITVGGELIAQWCIHAVGPNYRVSMSLGLSEDACDDLLRSAFKESMERAREHNVRTLAFSLISAGVFRGVKSVAEVLKIGLDTICDNSYDGLQEVHMVGFTESEISTLEKLCDEKEKQVEPDAKEGGIKEAEDTSSADPTSSTPTSILVGQMRRLRPGKSYRKGLKRPPDRNNCYMCFLLVLAYQPSFRTLAFKHVEDEPAAITVNSSFIDLFYSMVRDVTHGKAINVWQNHDWLWDKMVARPLFVGVQGDRLNDHQDSGEALRKMLDCMRDVAVSATQVVVEEWVQCSTCGNTYLIATSTSGTIELCFPAAPSSTAITTASLLETYLYPVNVEKKMLQHRTTQL